MSILLYGALCGILSAGSMVGPGSDSVGGSMGGSGFGSRGWGQSSVAISVPRNVESGGGVTILRLEEFGAGRNGGNGGNDGRSGAVVVDQVWRAYGKRNFGYVQFRNDAFGGGVHGGVNRPPVVESDGERYRRLVPSHLRAPMGAPLWEDRPRPL